MKKELKNKDKDKNKDKCISKDKNKKKSKKIGNNYARQRKIDIHNLIRNLHGNFTKENIKVLFKNKKFLAGFTVVVISLIIISSGINYGVNVFKFKYANSYSSNFNKEILNIDLLDKDNNISDSKAETFAYYIAKNKIQDDNSTITYNFDLPKNVNDKLSEIYSKVKINNNNDDNNNNNNERKEEPITLYYLNYNKDKYSISQITSDSNWNNSLNSIDNSTNNKNNKKAKNKDKNNNSNSNNRTIYAKYLVTNEKDSSDCYTITISNFSAVQKNIENIINLNNDKIKIFKCKNNNDLIKKFNNNILITTSSYCDINGKELDVNNYNYIYNFSKLDEIKNSFYSAEYLEYISTKYIKNDLISIHIPQVKNSKKENIYMNIEAHKFNKNIEFKDFKNLLNNINLTEVTENA